LKTINTLGGFQDFISRIFVYASHGSIFFDLNFLNSSVQV